MLLVGDVKIYYYDFDKKRTKNYGRAVSSVINEKITQLSEKFCSLGQTLNYYQQLKNNCPNDYLDILNVELPESARIRRVFRMYRRF